MRIASMFALSALVSCSGGGDAGAGSRGGIVVLPPDGPGATISGVGPISAGAGGAAGAGNGSAQGAGTSGASGVLAGSGAAGRGAGNPMAAGSGGSGQATAGRGGAGSGGAGNPGSGGSAANPYPPITGGCNGYATRYWDCCKPHCGWSANVAPGTAPLATCNQSDASLGGDYDAASSCDGGNAFMCHSMAPWAVSDSLAYGFAAIAARGDICGKCYQLQFTGGSHNGGNDPGSAALAGKTMIVQATNVGGDVGSGQFDILTPGGGVGTFNACSAQWGVSTSELGAQYGGFLTSCKAQVGGGDGAALKSCVMQRCASVFGARGLGELESGCRWFVDWFEAADNPTLLYKEIACPQELKSRGLNRSTTDSSACGV